MVFRSLRYYFLLSKISVTYTLYCAPADSTRNDCFRGTPCDMLGPFEHFVPIETGQKLNLLVVGGGLTLCEGGA
jgi:hypothetical protein